jgi:hypothetical protein
LLQRHRGVWPEILWRNTGNGAAIEGPQAKSIHTLKLWCLLALYGDAIILPYICNRLVKLRLIAETYRLNQKNSDSEKV